MQKIKKLTPLFIAIFFFISFGLYHITQFETVDEHFWKYERVKKYYIGIKEGFSENSWKKTRINDKPGVTVALLSGMSLPFIPDPYAHRDYSRENQFVFPTQKSPDDKIKDREMYVLYNINQTESINLGFRLPILLFNGLIMLPLLFWLVWKTFGWKTSALTILLIGLNPILIGISQIPNPDSLLWSFSAAAIFSFLALLKTEQKKFIILTGIFTGFALLSKYTANLLFIFYPIIFILYQIFEGTKDKNCKKLDHQSDRNTTWQSRALKSFKFITKPIKNLTTQINSKFPKIKKISQAKITTTSLKYIFSFSSIFLIACLIVIIFMPAIIQTPKHFLYATIYSPVLAPLTDIFIDIFHIKKYLILTNGKYLTIRMAIFSFAIFSFLFIFLPPFIFLLFKKFQKTFIILLKITTAILIFLFVISFFNAWTNASLFGLDDLKEVSRNKGKVTFDQFAGDPAPIFYLKALLVQAQNFIFSLHPLVVLITLTTLILVIFNKIKQELWTLYFITLTPFIFLIGAMLSNVFVNVRYSIMLYPLFALLAGIGSIQMINLIQNTQNKKTLFKNITLKTTYSKQLNEVMTKLTKNLYPILFSLIIFTHLISLWNIKPFYFNYTNSLLPKKFVVTDAWGYGFYEAAEYLNSLPDAENLVVWLDRSGVCQFFVGKCIASREIYFDHTDVDYLVLTRRGSIIKHPEPITDNETHYFTQQNFYSEQSLNNPAWQISIDNRPKNFVKIIKVER